MSAGPVMILAGGTGGHVFPALAVAEVLRRRSVPVVWMGTRAGLEARVVPAADIPMEWLTVRGLRGKGLRGWLAAPLMLLRALAQAVRIVARHRPRAVLGMGGYVAGPGALAAWLLRRPLVIHEQNAVAGMTNRCLARLATRVLTGFDVPLGGSGRSEWTGNPVRGAIAALPDPARRYTDRRGRYRLLVLGGSLGARGLNRRLPQALARLPQPTQPVVRHQAGQAMLEATRTAYRDHAVAAEVTAFIDDMATAYGWADLVICRAGALTVAEIAAAGVAAVFVPFPHAVDDHQSTNAGLLVDAGAAVLVQESELTAERLEAVLRDLLGDRGRLQTMAQRARMLGRADAAERVATVCLEVER